uniref:Uncharacterized protein n=1 Tax=Astatotilapia calliptera TaxID=8154 RepID=A0AAX7TLC7_ASTCA
MDSIISVIGTYVSWDLKSLLLFAAVFIITADYIKNRQPAGYPPGPRGLPIMGNLFTIDQNRAHESMTQLAERYGNVYSLRMGQERMVVLNGFDILKEALVTQGDSLADRPDLPLQIDRAHRLGVIASSGNLWKQQRRFALSTLRQFGFGKKSLESVVLDEFTYCAKNIRSYKGKPFDPHLILNNAVSNIICSLVFGHRFEYSEEKFIKMMQLFDKGFQIEGSIWGQIYNAFPVLMRRLPGPHQSVGQMWNEVKDFIRVELNEHKKTWDPSETRDYIDCYLSEIQMNKGQDDNTFDEENLVICVLDLFVAGSETTSTTLRWTNMVYVIFHFVCFIYHYSNCQGVIVIPNLTSVLFDKKEWETPHTFNPNHFLNEECKFVKRAAFLPFSLGKRVCLGENLAKMELFLFFTSFMQHFTFSMPAGVKPDMDYRFGLTLTPKNYEICVTPPI